MMNVCSFLTAEEMKTLTGATHRAKQKLVLDKNRIRYVEQEDGKLKVAWVSLLGNDLPTQTKQKEPDFSHLT
mgnify:CR=1 FL=1